MVAIMNREQKQKEYMRKMEQSLEFVLSDELGRFFISEVLGEFTLADGMAFTGDNATFKKLGQQQVYMALKSRVETMLGINGFNYWQKMDKEKFERRADINATKR